VEAGEKILLLRTGDIEWLQSTGNLVRVHMGSQYHVLRQSLTKLHELLDPARFLRVHRNAIVNLDQVDEFHLPTLGNMFVKLRSGFCLPLRKSSRALLRRNLITTPQRLSE
jgi:two-component system LytT family response regulator